jgi:hypothetical protein
MAYSKRKRLAYQRAWRKQNPNWRRGLAKYRVRGPRVLILGVMVNWRAPHGQAAIQEG